MEFETKDFVPELIKLLKEFSLLEDTTNIFYNNTTYHYKNNTVTVLENTKVTDYISPKCEDTEGLIFASVSGLETLYYRDYKDVDRDFHDDLMELTDKFDVLHEFIDSTTFYIFQE
ncbi:MAG: hypothetical protein ACLS90_05545 [Clostridia bacterium]